MQKKPTAGGKVAKREYCRPGNYDPMSLGHSLHLFVRRARFKLQGARCTRRKLCVDNVIRKPHCAHDLMVYDGKLLTGLLRRSAIRCEVLAVTCQNSGVPSKEGLVHQ
jgi:hypothetical protein